MLVEGEFVTSAGLSTVDYTHSVVIGLNELFFAGIRHRCGY